MSYYLPDETTRAIEKQVSMCKNLGLILDKYPTKLSFEKSTKEDKRKGKTAWLLSILEPENPNDKIPNNHIDSQLAHNVYDRWLSMTRAMGAKPFSFSAVTDWRMVVGLGGETVLETDLTLHHLYGIPYIPGSALKGLTRAYVTGELEGYRSENINNDNEEVEQIFGSQKRAGTVIFFDAMPIDGKATFALDIMNSHYSKYYGENALPTNDQDPNPVTFLTVASTKFMFALAPRSPQARSDANKAKEWLQKALQQYGVGGKTSAGYGYFTKFESQPRLPEDAYVAKEDVSQPLEPYIRPDIPVFREGQKIAGVVIDPKKDQEALKRLESGVASACLKYKDREFSTKKLFILIPPEYPEAENWSVGNMKNCFFVREEVQGDCTVLICRP